MTRYVKSFLRELKNDTDSNLDTLRTHVDVLTMKGLRCNVSDQIVYKTPEKVKLTLSLEMSSERCEMLMMILEGSDL